MTEVKRIAEEKVIKATGKSWQEWFKIYDLAKTNKWTHSMRAKWLSDNYRIDTWWCQTITVAYEQERGLRKVHEMPDGFQISTSKTVPKTVGELFTTIKNIKDIEWTTQHHNKVLRGKYSNSNLTVYFYPKDANKTQVVIQQSKIKTSALAEKMKQYWRKYLNETL